MVEAGSSLVQIFLEESVLQKVIDFGADTSSSFGSRKVGEAKIVMRFWVIAGCLRSLSFSWRYRRRAPKDVSRGAVDEGYRVEVGDAEA